MHRRQESGAVTAETAVALPLLAVFAISMAWLVSLGITQVRALDAARETARAAARSDGSGSSARPRTTSRSVRLADLARSWRRDRGREGEQPGEGSGRSVRPLGHVPGRGRGGRCPGAEAVRSAATAAQQGRAGSRDCARGRHDRSRRQRDRRHLGCRRCGRRSPSGPVGCRSLRARRRHDAAERRRRVCASRRRSPDATAQTCSAARWTGPRWSWWSRGACGCRVCRWSSGHALARDRWQNLA